MLNRWLIFLIGFLTATLLCVAIIPIIIAKKLQRDLQEAAKTGNFSGLQESIGGLQKSFPALDNFSHEQMEEMMKKMGIDKEEEPAVPTEQEKQGSKTLKVKIE